MRNPDLIWLDDPENHNFHDAKVVSIKLIPAKSNRSKNNLEVLLTYYNYDREFLLTFTNCLNVFASIDFGIPDCEPCSVDHFSITKDPGTIKRQITDARPHWNLSFADEPTDPTTSYISEPSPLPQRVLASTGFSHFKFRIFGGILSVIAKSYKVQRLRKKPESH